MREAWLREYRLLTANLLLFEWLRTTTTKKLECGNLSICVHILNFSSYYKYISYKSYCLHMISHRQICWPQATLVGYRGNKRTVKTKHFLLHHIRSRINKSYFRTQFCFQVCMLKAIAVFWIVWPILM